MFPEVPSMAKPEYKESFFSKFDYFKKPSVSEDNYKKTSYVQRYPLWLNQNTRSHFFPKFDYFKKPLAPEDKYKKAPYVPEVSAEPKPEYKVPS